MDLGEAHTVLTDTLYLISVYIVISMCLLLAVLVVLSTLSLVDLDLMGFRFDVQSPLLTSPLVGEMTWSALRCCMLFLFYFIIDKFPWIVGIVIVLMCTEGKDKG